MGMEGLKQLLERLPGWGAYRRREMRREIDRRLREELAREVERLRQRLTQIQQDLLQQGGLLWMDDLEAVQQKFHLFIDKLRSAADGYRPLLDLETVDEAQLQRLWEFDQALARRVADLAPLLEALANAQKPQALREAIAALRQGLQQLVDILEGRENLVRHPQARPPQQEG